MRSVRTIRQKTIPRKRQLARRQDGLLTRTFAPMRLPSVADPQTTNRTVTLTQRFQGTVPLDEGNVTIATLASFIPGGLTYWSRLRVEKVTIWSVFQFTTTTTPVAELVVSIPAGDSDGLGSAPVQFVDNGTVGQAYPCVSFKPSLPFRMRWFNPASTDIVCAVTSGSGNNSYIVEAVMEIVSPSL